MFTTCFLPCVPRSRQHPDYIVALPAATWPAGNGVICRHRPAAPSGQPAVFFAWRQRLPAQPCSALKRLFALPRHRRFWGRALLPALLLCLPYLACAQQAPTPPARDTAATPRADTTATPAVAPAAGGATSAPSTDYEEYNRSGRGLRYTASLTGQYAAGTVERTLLSTTHALNLAFRGGRFRLPVGFSFSYGRQDARLRERELLLTTTPSLTRGRFKYYGQAEAGRSNLRAIDYRVLTGLGLGRTLYQDTLGQELGLSYFLLYEKTRYLNGLTRQVPRHSIRLKTKLVQGPVTFDLVAFYQPNARSPTTDYRVNGTAALGVRVSRHLALTASYVYTYERISVEGRSPTNTNLTVGVTYATGN